MVDEFRTLSFWVSDGCVNSSPSSCSSFLFYHSVNFVLEPLLFLLLQFNIPNLRKAYLRVLLFIRFWSLFMYLFIYLQRLLALEEFLPMPAYSLTSSSISEEIESAVEASLLKVNFDVFFLFDNYFCHMQLYFLFLIKSVEDFKMQMLHECNVRHSPCFYIYKH